MSIMTNLPTTYPGPLSNDDSLTENELALLLAIPRGAEKTPNATMFRLPLGPDPTDGWVDITFGEARSIIPRLALDWKTRLSEGTGLNIGPGTIICLLVQPIVHAMLHWLAFWALGCSIQVMSMSMDDETTASYLDKSGCRVVVHWGISDLRLEAIRSVWNGNMIMLSEEEHAHQLALKNKGQTDPTVPWPDPQRPDPALITHSSGSTGTTKSLPFSLYFCTLSLPSQQNPDSFVKPEPRPFLVFSPSYWTSFNQVLIHQLATGSAVAFARVLDISQFPSGQLMSWIQGLGCSGVICAPRFLRDILASGFESDINYLQGMANIAVSGTALDEPTAALAEKYKLKLINIFGCTELGTIMIATRPPFTHLRLIPGSHPLVLPISDTGADGSRQVQFWFSRSTSPRFAHLYVKGGVPLKFEPFPGEGPHKGEPAMKLDDIFKEVRSGSEVLYVYLGRSDDLIKLAGRGGWDINASAYETALASTITLYLASQVETKRWTVDGVQLFGNNRPCTALVIQLSSGDQSETGQDLVKHLSILAKAANDKLNLDLHVRVHPQKRMLIITSEGKVYGPGVKDSKDVPRLMVTHKHTLQRWKNVEAFGSWLDGLDYSEP